MAGHVRGAHHAAWLRQSPFFLSRQRRFLSSVRGLALTGMAPGPGVALPGRLAGSVAPSHRLHGLGTWAFPAFCFSQRAICVPRRKSSVSTACGKASLLPGMWASCWRCPWGSSRWLLLPEPHLRGPRCLPAESWPGPGSVLPPGLSRHLLRGSRCARCSGRSLVCGAFSQTKRLFRCLPGSHFNY